jgi:hypothetical protein
MFMQSATILISNRTRERLKEIGKKGQTYDQLINELISLKRNDQAPLDGRLRSLHSSESSSPVEVGDPK